MTRLLIIGYGPLPARECRQGMGPGLRTCQFVQGAIEGGHEVHLFTLPPPHGPAEPGGEARIETALFEGIEYQRFSHHSGEYAAGVLNDKIAAIAPEAIVGVGAYCSYLAAMLSTTLPLWCDLTGMWMAEMQGRCKAEGEDGRLVGSWAIERGILRRADKFSAVSRPQLHAMIGEMGTIGRLNRHTFDYQFGAHIPNSAHGWDFPEEIAPEPRESSDSTPNEVLSDSTPSESAEPASDADQAETSDPKTPKSDDAGPVLRGSVVPETAFVVLWSGSFGVSSDVDVLIHAMDDLMDHHGEVHFVSTGAGIEGADGRVYSNFENAVAASAHRERYHLLGWVEAEKLARIYEEADLGINVDAPNYETFFGARSRLNAMATAGLPILTTLGTEISEWLHDGRAALTVHMGKPHEIVEAIEPWIDQREGLKPYAERARRIMETDFSISTTTRGFRKWLESPELAPDNEAKVRTSHGELADFNTATINTLESQTMMLDEDPRSLMQSRREIEAMRQRPWFQAYQKFRKLLGE